MKRKLTLIAAARPNFMKIAPLARELNKYPNLFEYQIVHTGQHYDKNMSDSFFEQLNIPYPDVNLEVGSGSHAVQTAEVMMKFEKYLLEYQPDLVVVVGDVNSTMACAITAKKIHIPVAHVEAGLRSFDRKMPEEINRLVTDAISDILYTPSEDGDEQLFKEGVEKEKVIFIGNIMIDTLVHQKQAAVRTKFYQSMNLEEKEYAVVTLHRPSNVDQKATFQRIMNALEEIKKEKTIIWPVHPRAKAKLKAFGFDENCHFGTVQKHGINLIDPIGYNQMLNLVMHAGLVLTDSGGLQEETTYLQVPCLTLRENTERPVTITNGTNQLVGTDTSAILKAYRLVKDYSDKLSKGPRFWDGKSAERIVNHLTKYFS